MKVILTVALIALVWSPGCTDLCASPRGPSAFWYEPGMFVQARDLALNPGNSSYERLHYTPLDEKEKARWLPFNDPDVSHLYHGDYILSTVGWTPPGGGLYGLGRDRNESLSPMPVHLVARAPWNQADAESFLRSVATLDDAQARVLADDWHAAETSDSPKNQANYMWELRETNLTLRLTQLFQSLHPQIHEGKEPVVDSGWNFNFHPQGVGGVHFSITALDHVTSSTGYYPTAPTTEDEYKALLRDDFVRHGLPQPTFQDLEFHPADDC